MLRVICEIKLKLEIVYILAKEEIGIFLGTQFTRNFTKFEKGESFVIFCHQAAAVVCSLNHVMF